MFRREFKDRAHAGLQLAAALEQYSGQDVVILGVPRGGVPVAAAVAHALNAPLDVLISRKIGHPHQRELAVGAVVGDAGDAVLNEELIEALHVPADYLEAETKRLHEEIRRRARVYRGGRPPSPVAGKVAILIDDGVATGYTLKAAVTAVRALGPEKLVLAVPVASHEAVAMLRPLVDELICLEEPDFFRAVGLHYRDFGQVPDEEVTELLSRNGRQKSN